MKLLLPVLFPILAGIFVLLSKRLGDSKKLLPVVVLATLTAELVLVWSALLAGGEVQVWQLTETISISFAIDGISRLFAGLTALVWLLAGAYGLPYMERESHLEKESHPAHFFGFFLMVEGVLMGLDFSSNLITMYAFYELMTLTSLPLVLHERTEEAVMAGLKYLFYSVAGAFLALFGIFFLASLSGHLDFVPGGILQAADAGALPGTLAGKEGLLLWAVLCMIIGFGAKAGMFPLHGWLPTAHPEAPAPASAVLSGVITKAGVLALIRIVYYVAGPDLIRGTWVQSAWMLLSLLTVFMGSMLAYKEQVFKKRLAYSTVSQVSYVLFGLSLLQPVAFSGALAHVVFHSVIKNGLFFVAGAIIVKTGWTRAGQMGGLGRTMPVTLGCYTLLSLALIGIPPASGFVSKWYLATGSLASQTGVWAFAGPVVLLVSALLTAGYLLPVTIRGFFPGRDFEKSGQTAGKADGREQPALPEASDFQELPAMPQTSALRELPVLMLVPILILAAASLLLGCFPGKLMQMLDALALSVF